VGARFFAHVQTDPGTHPASCTKGTGSFLEVESGRGVTLTPHPFLVPRSKNRVKLYLYSPKGPSWPVKRVKATYILNSLSTCMSQLRLSKQFHQCRIRTLGLTMDFGSPVAFSNIIKK
jgi:hypothetical protein